MATRKKATKATTTGVPAEPMPKSRKGGAAPRNPKLEEAIALNPESPDGYLVYGDWLLEQGDSLGDLVATQAALAKGLGVAKVRKELEKKEKILLAKHTKALGSFASQEHTWSFGFLDGIRLEAPTPALYKELLDLVAARFLRELDLELFDAPEWNDRQPNIKASNKAIITAVAELGIPHTVRKLSLMTSSTPSGDSVIDVSILYRRLTYLRELVIRARQVMLGAIDLPALETFSLDTQPTKGIFESIASAKWPMLRSLSIGFCDATASALPFKQVKGLLDAIPASVTHLGISGHSVGDELLKTLCTWRPLAKLTSLDLSGTTISNTGCKVLLQHAKSFEHLESFNLSENDLSSSSCKALEKAFGDAVDTEGQGDRVRYDGISE